jgi:hypothetical protein
VTVATTNDMNPREHAYDEFEAAVAASLAADGPLFTTDVDPESLWDEYLDAIPEAWRSHYTCRTCRNFVTAVGGLVRVGDDGSRVSAAWPESVPPFFAEAARRLRAIVEAAKINGVFLASEPVLGVATNVSKKTGATWTHLHAKNRRPWRKTTLTASQKMAALVEDHGVLCRSFAEYGEDVAAEALRVLESDHLDRSSKAVELVRWYINVLRDRKSPALVWKAVAGAPLGWCHVKNTVVSTLMDDVANGVSFETAKKKWAEKMHPLQYMRPQAAPTDGAIERAEKIAEKLGIARSLERRFARLDELTEHLLWTPRAEENESKDGVFGHLRTKPVGVKRMQLPAKTVSMETFVADVLPTAKRVTLDLSYSDNFVGLTTAVRADAPPLLRWDYEDERNPFAWYGYHGGSSPQAWGLTMGTRDVAAILYGPPSWTKDSARLKRHETDTPRQMVFVLAGARDSRGGCPALFPECLRGELHEVRSVIEAHNNRTKASGAEEASANGIAHGVKSSREVVVDGERYTIKN